MNELGDYQISEPAADPGEPDAGGPPGKGSPSVWTVLAVVAGLALLAALYFWFFGRGPRPDPLPAETDSPAAEAPATVPRVEEEPLEELETPELDASDEIVRQLVSRLSAHPKLASWLVTDDLVRRFVAAVDNVAEGDIPTAHVGFLGPKEEFSVRGSGDQQVIDPQSYRRFDALAEVVASLDTEGTAKLYRQLKPLVNEAYADLGYPNREFDRTLARAIDVVLTTPEPPENVEVVAKVESFAFADPELEELDPVQKQLLRFGPGNLRKIKAKLRSLKAALPNLR